MRRERRIGFDGRPDEIHPYDVTVEREGAGEAWDCKWGARGIKADVLHQLDDARRGAADEGGRLLVGLVVFDARRSCEVRLVRERGPVALEGLKLIALRGLAAARAAAPDDRPNDACGRGTTVCTVHFTRECGPTAARTSSRPLRAGRRVIHPTCWASIALVRGARLAWVVRAMELAILADPARLDAGPVDGGPRFRRSPARRRSEGRRQGWARARAHRLGDHGHGRGVWAGSRRGQAGLATVAGSSPGVPSRPRPRRDLLALVAAPDLDPMGHVNNAAYVDYLRRACSPRAARRRRAGRHPRRSGWVPRAGTPAQPPRACGRPSAMTGGGPGGSRTLGTVWHATVDAG